jgi:hypothetical protein
MPTLVKRATCPVAAGAVLIPACSAAVGETR